MKCKTYLALIFLLLFLVTKGTNAFNAENIVLSEWLAVPTGLGAISPKPLPVKGSCKAGKEYVITSVFDLYRNVDELECVFSAGSSPLAPPLGFSYGYLLAAANSAYYDLFAEAAYQGDFTVKTQCNGVYLTIGWLSIGGIKPGTALWTVGSPLMVLGPKPAEGEFPFTQKITNIMDFTVDFHEVCKTEGVEKENPLPFFSPFNNSLWPINQFIDIGLVVGRDSKDDGFILLNKAYITPKNKEDGAATVLFYATKTFDPNVSTMVSGSVIVVPPGPNLEDVIEYRRGAIASFMQRLDPTKIFGNIFNLRNQDSIIGPLFNAPRILSSKTLSEEPTLVSEGSSELQAKKEKIQKSINNLLNFMEAEKPEKEFLQLSDENSAIDSKGSEGFEEELEKFYKFIERSSIQNRRSIIKGITSVLRANAFLNQ